MNSTVKRWGVVLVGVVAVGLVITIANKRDRSESIRIGVIYAGTGPASFAGKPEQEVLALLEKGNIEGAPVGAMAFKLDMKDSGGDKDKAINFYEQFCKDPRCVAVIGPTASGESIAVASKALEMDKELRLPILSLAASSKIVLDPRDSSRVNPIAFKFAQNDDLAARRLASVIRSQIKNGKVAFLYSDDGFGKSGAEVFPRAASEESLNLELPLRSFAANLNAPDAVVSSLPPNVNGVVVWGSAPGPALLVKKIRDIHPGLPIFLSHGNASQEFIASVGARGNGVILVGSRVLMSDSALNAATVRDKRIRDFQHFWEGATHKPQSHFAGHAYDAFEVLRSVINKGAKTRGEVRSAIEQLGTYEGVTGVFRFTEDDHAGLDTTAFEVYRIQDDAFVPVVESRTSE